MLSDKIINKALSGFEQTIEIQTSRCVRMRFNKNACPVCTQNCRTGAISLEGGVSIDPGKCTHCMMCAAECPSDCFTIGRADFWSLLGRLRKSEASNPVLGCRKAADANAHEKCDCMGFLSEEHLIALAMSLDKTVYLNLTSCGGCENSFVVDMLKERVKTASTKSFFDIAAKVVLVENRKDLFIEDVCYDRRDFFKAFKNMTLKQVSGLIAEKKPEIIKSYSEKKIPLRRDLLNTMIKKMRGVTSAGILQNYAFTVKTGTSCNNCFACIGMCPTGALKIKKDDAGTGLLFNSSLCNGCALCRDFCPLEAVSVSKGFSGSSYFEYHICNSGTYVSVAAEDRDEGIGIAEAAYQGR